MDERDYLRALSPEEYAARLTSYLREQGVDWDEALVRETVPLVQDKIGILGEYPDFVRFLFGEVEVDPALLDGGGAMLEGAGEVLAEVEPFTAEPIEAALRGLAERLELKPRQAFQPVRVAVTGSKISPGLFESLELLGRDVSLARIEAARRALV